MKIQVIAEASTKFERKFIGWGISILIDDDVLFDTFSTPNELKKNLLKYSIDIQKIKHIIISHDHWDHTGGLWWVLNNNKNATIYVCKNFSEETINKIKKSSHDIKIITQPIKIKQGIYTTGQIQGLYKENPIFEQSLVLKTNDISILTGCSHPGIINILNTVSSQFPKDTINLILGGFHLYDKTKDQINKTIQDLEQNFNFNLLAPCHCTGPKAGRMFNKYFNTKYIKVKKGFTINI